jgi:hypothetical protein
MSLIDVIVGTAIMLVVFLSIFGAFKLSIDLIYSTKAKVGAVALVADRLEYIRSLPYASVGTVGGIPSGNLPQVATSTLNGITYVMSTLVQYVDDPADGTGNSDSNGITADYKLVKVEADWMIRTSSRATSAVTTVTPVGLETLANGGTLTVNVLNAVAAAVPGATVTIINASTSPAINVSEDTNNAGAVSFPGAPVAGNYQITVGKAGYSSAQTYAANAQNPNPSPGNVAIVNHKTSTTSFSIDQLGKLHTYTFSPAGPGSFADTFSDQSKLFATSSATVGGGSLKLTQINGAYSASGNAISIPITPQYLAQWGTFAATSSAPAGTSLSYRLYYFTNGAYTPIPDSAVPGNTAGFASTTVDLSSLPVATYGMLELGAFMGTASSTLTPTVADWSLSYSAGPTPLPNVAMTIHGAKTTGTTAGGVPIYKYTGAFTTTQYGDWLIDPIEWDLYTMALSGATYDVSERCPDAVSILPGATLTESFILVPHTAQSLKVYVPGSGVALQGATVAVGKGGATTTLTTSACGQTFFGNLASGTYTIAASKSGFQTAFQSVTLAGATEVTVPLSP